MAGRNVVRAWCAAVVLLAAAAPGAGAASLRSPQVPFVTAALQGWLDGVDPGIDVAHAQLARQAWTSSPAGYADYVLRVGRKPADTAVGLYNADDPAPVPALFEVIPAALAVDSGWFAYVHFTDAGANVLLFDGNDVLEGTVFRSGVHRAGFGLYARNALGTSFSEDLRNAGGLPQALAYESPSDPTAAWVCFEPSPYAAPSSTFDGVVIRWTAYLSTPARTGTWGSLKALYR